MRRTTGYDDVRLHDLRHLAGTLTAQAGATLQEIMDRLGHSTTAAALRYQHVAADRSQIIADRIGRSLSDVGVRALDAPSSDLSRCEVTEK